MVKLSCYLCGEPTEPFEQNTHSYCAAIENIPADMMPGILSASTYLKVDGMTRARNGAYIWVTWLSRLMAGEVRCQWSPWFRAHHTEYVKAPSDFQLATWTAEHTQLLDELVRERSALGESTYKEDQNHFRGRRRSGLTIAGKPDLIAIDRTSHATVYDAKTGKPRHSDIIQVMLYMMLLPFASPLYKGKALKGCVVYKSGDHSDIPPEAIDEAFQKNVTYFLDLLESGDPPERSPSHAECRYCDITSADCPDRIEAVAEGDLQTEDPEIPL